ncbi:MAG: peptidoglycan DD-metalloendopeptidase family protein [Chloroflexota bacterium]
MRFFLGNPVNTKFRVTNSFNSPRNYANGLHEGIDLRAQEDGKPVDILAAQRGVVDRVRPNGTTGYGHYVRIRHEWDDRTTWVTWYAHMSELDPAISVGTQVRIGQRLGLAGTTGNSTGIHLHLTLQHLGYGLKGYVVDDVVDPRPYFTTVSYPDYDEASYVSDITVPDGAVLKAGRRFNKIWQVRNTGSSTWGKNYVLAFHNDERMDGPDSVLYRPFDRASLVLWRSNWWHPKSRGVTDRPGKGAGLMANHSARNCMRTSSSRLSPGATARYTLKISLSLMVVSLNPAGSF